MRILYIFPHPDDESFGPAASISKFKRLGHEVHLLTLTKGGATKQRFKYNYTIDEMGDVRYKEMLNVEKTLDLDSMKVLDMPDSGLKEMDPRDIEEVVEKHIRFILPDVIVSYPVHGISGFHDHLITHAVVKRVFIKLKEENLENLKRLAFFTLNEEYVTSNKGMFKLNFSTEKEIDCIMKVDEVDRAKNREALACYVTYKEVIDKSIGNGPKTEFANFEIFQEEFDPALSDLTLHLD